MEKKISVVIPTYNRPKLLGKCLQYLSSQTFPFDDFEVIVVTDGPDVNTAKVVEAMVHLLPVKLLSLPHKQGPAAARNLGWQQAQGALIAFTDDDCLPTPQWLQDAWAGYDGNDLVAYTGKVLVPLSPHPTDYELNTAGLEQAEFVTANCFVTKKALQVTGGFDESYKLAWREDSDLQFKLLCCNIPIYKNEKAVVKHPVRPAPWGVCIKEQQKNLYDALLYKKFPSLYKTKIKAGILWHYYAMILLFLGGIISWVNSATPIALVCFTGWLMLVTWFTLKRLHGTTKSMSHVIEMVVTSMVIPFLSVYWTLYGAYKYRVLFF